MSFRDYHTCIPSFTGRGEKPPVEEVLEFLKGWRNLPREKVLLAFEGGHFAGIEEMKNNQNLFNRVAPLAVNDIMMAIQYKYDKTAPPLNVPIIAFEGKKDNTIPNGYMKKWRQHTSSSYKHIQVDGTHYFVSTHYKDVTYRISTECMSAIDQVSGGILGEQHSWVGGNGIKHNEIKSGPLNKNQTWYSQILRHFFNHGNANLPLLIINILASALLFILFHLFINQ